MADGMDGDDVLLCVETVVGDGTWAAAAIVELEQDVGNAVLRLPHGLLSGLVPHHKKRAAAGVGGNIGGWIVFLHLCGGVVLCVRSSKQKNG